MLESMDENWESLKEQLPTNWCDLAKSKGAIRRKYRKIDSIESMLRMFFMHTIQGLSLRETVAQARFANIVSLSDVGLLKRLRRAKEWLKTLCMILLEEMGVRPIKNSRGIRLRAVDATRIKEPGKKGTLWSIHYSMDLSHLNCDFLEITLNKGRGNGEQFKRFPVSEGECIIGDRGYATSAGISYVSQNNGYSLVRVNTRTLPLFDKKGDRLDLLTHGQKLVKPGRAKEWEAFVKKDGHMIKGRICMLRKSKSAEKKTLSKLVETAKRKGHTLQPTTKKYGKYVILFTTLPTKQFSLRDVLKAYRLRWQIELSFKRLKSLMGIGHLPKYNPESSLAWLYCKLLGSLLMEKMMRGSNSFFSKVTRGYARLNVRRNESAIVSGESFHFCYVPSKWLLCHPFC